jgi:hypothetical protein
MRYLKVFNLSLLAKWKWQVLVDKSSLLKDVLVAK